MDDSTPSFFPCWHDPRSFNVTLSGPTSEFHDLHPLSIPYSSFVFSVLRDGLSKLQTPPCHYLISHIHHCPGQQRHLKRPVVKCGQDVQGIVLHLTSLPG